MGYDLQVRQPGRAYKTVFTDVPADHAIWCMNQWLFPGQTFSVRLVHSDSKKPAIVVTPKKGA